MCLRLRTMRRNFIRREIDQANLPSFRFSWTCDIFSQRDIQVSVTLLKLCLFDHHGIISGFALLPEWHTLMSTSVLSWFLLLFFLIFFVGQKSVCHVLRLQRWKQGHGSFEGEAGRCFLQILDKKCSIERDVSVNSRESVMPRHQFLLHTHSPSPCGCNITTWPAVVVTAKHGGLDVNGLLGVSTFRIL